MEQEALALFHDARRLSEQAGDKYLQAYICTEIATTSLSIDEFQQAVEHSSRSLEILRELQMEQLTTTPLALLALANLANHNHNQANNYALQSLAQLNASGAERIPYPQRDYYYCYQVFDAIDQSELARQALVSAQQFMQKQANKISNAAMRKTFLENVRFNREISSAVHSA